MTTQDTSHAQANATPAATLSLNGKQTGLEVRSGTIGPQVIDIAKVYRDTGCFTYDPGFTSTANCSSRITYIDGDKGELLYRGYSIDERSRSSGGHQGIVLRRDMPDEIRKLVFQARPGDLLEPVKVAQHWEVILIEELFFATLDDSTRESIQSQLFEEWMIQQHGSISIPLIAEI